MATVLKVVHSNLALILSTILSIMPALAFATNCYDSKWAILSGSTLEIRGKTPGEVCSKARNIESLAYPSQTLISLVPNRWAFNFADYKFEVIGYNCTYFLLNPAQNLSKTQSYQFQHYFKSVGTSEYAWAYGALPREDDCTCCSGDGGAGGSATGVGGKGYHGDRAGFPITYTDLSKTKFVTDWTSSRDARFSFDRFYSSTIEGTRSYSQVSFGESWWSPFERTIVQIGNKHTLYLEEGRRHEFHGSTYAAVYSAKMSDHSYRMLRDPPSDIRTSIPDVEDGKGRQDTYSVWRDYNTSSATRRVHKLSEIKWADGYKITITRDTNKRISVVHDNKGQRAEFAWFVVPNSSPEVALVDKILIDTSYDGSSFAADIELDYEYQSFATHPHLAFAISSQTRDLANAAVLKKQEYFYDTSTADLSPARMIAFRDGRFDASGQPFDAERYAFDTASTGPLGTVATSTALSDAASTFTSQMDASGDTSFTNPLGKMTNFDIEIVDGRKRIVSVTGVPGAGCLTCLGTEVAVSFAAPQGMAKGWIYSRTERNGSQTNFTRDARGLILTKTEDVGGASPRVTSYTWHSTLRLPLTRTSSGLVETFAYTTQGLLTGYSQRDTQLGSPTNGQVRSWTYGYTTLASGLKVLASVDGPGLVADGITDITTYTYTALGELATSTSAAGLVTTVIARNDQGQPTVVEEPNKNRWYFTYDRLGRVETSGVAGPGETPALNSFVYDIVGQLVSMTNTRLQTWTFTYDNDRRLTTTTSPSGDVANFTYDGMGNLTRTEYQNGTAPAQFWEETEFDDLSRVLKSIGAMGQEWTYSYDEEDNLVGEADPLTNTTINGFDGLNRLTAVADRESFSTGYAFDPSDRMTTFTDPRMLTTTFTYNGFGDVLMETSADRGTISYTYDQRGLTTSRTDGRGITVSYAYDNDGRLTLVNHPTGGTPDTTYTWDQAFMGIPADANKGQIGRVSDGILQSDFAHNLSATGPQLAVTMTYPAGRSYTMFEDWDFEGNRTLVDYPSGNQVEYTYDDDNRVIRVRMRIGTDWNVLVDQITYHPYGPISGMVFGDGFAQTLAHDNSYRLTAVLDGDATTVLRDLTYTYEQRNNLATISDAQVPLNSETFGYTARESLASATGPYGLLAFTYDGVGNRITAWTGSVVDSYAYPSTSNRLSTVTPAGGPSRALTYDAAGNVIGDDQAAVDYSYTYDSAGRMATASADGVVVGEYIYDHLGRQVIRSLPQVGVTIHSVFDSESNRIAEYDGATGAMLREYVWLGLQPIAVIQAGIVHYIRTDHIGRPVFATDATGAVAWSASYSPFGGVVISTGTPIEARFPGQWFQAETGLHQNWMREYDPTTGRYMQADPLGLVDGASVYGYVRQNPGRWIDPKGEFGVAGAAGGAAVSVSLQLFANIAYGNMNLWQAVKCINLLPVFNAAAFGGYGFSPVALIRSGRGAANAAGAVGLGTHINRVSPDFYVGGNECGECDLPSAPEWVGWMRDILL